MTTLRKCDVCGASYLDPQANGARYFHACPDVANQAFQPDLAAPDYDPRETVRRDNHRDERPLPGMEYLDGKLNRPQHDPESNAPVLRPGEYAIVSTGKGGA